MLDKYQKKTGHVLKICFSQVAQSINHRMCYKYKKIVEMKKHQHFVDFAEEWEQLSPQERKEMLETKQTRGFRRPSLLRFWNNFDMVFGFCQDVMHQLDEGVVRWFVRQIVSKDSLLNLPRLSRNGIEKRWLNVTVPGHENRKLRSLTNIATMKAHELRFFIQHCGPFVTKGLVPDEFHELICLVSRIAWLATQDMISLEDVTEIEKKGIRFLKKFQKFFGQEEIKYSIHLML